MFYLLAGLIEYLGPSGIGGSREYDSAPGVQGLWDSLMRWRPDHGGQGQQVGRLGGDYLSKPLHNGSSSGPHGVQGL